jgi:hypothetical protein
MTEVLLSPQRVVEGTLGILFITLQYRWTHHNSPLGNSIDRDPKYQEDGKAT